MSMYIYAISSGFSRDPQLMHQARARLLSHTTALALSFGESLQLHELGQETRLAWGPLFPEERLILLLMCS